MDGLDSCRRGSMGGRGRGGGRRGPNWRAAGGPLRTAAGAAPSQVRLHGGMGIPAGPADEAQFQSVVKPTVCYLLCALAFRRSVVLRTTDPLVSLIVCRQSLYRLTLSRPRRAVVHGRASGFGRGAGSRRCASGARVDSGGSASCLKMTNRDGSRAHSYRHMTRTWPLQKEQ